MRLVFLLLLTLTVSAQKLHHQSISSQGLSLHSVNGLLVKQSVGQQSVIGNSKANNLFLGQGFLQGKFTNFEMQPNVSLIETSVYPNPFESEINLSIYLDTPQNITVTLYNSVGQEMMVPVIKSGKLHENTLKLELPDNLSSGLYNETLNISGLNSGIYSINVKGKNALGTQKLIVE